MCDVMNDALFPRQVSNCTLYDWINKVLCYVMLLSLIDFRTSYLMKCEPSLFIIDFHFYDTIRITG